jgi:thioredoxin reductase (NADPH)
MDKPLDCLIVGGGPAGLTAAIYLARFHLDILVVDDGKGRAESIPCTHNHAGFPDGISGKELVRLMREQAQRYGARIESDYVARLDLGDDGLFTATWGSGCVTAKTVLIATGVKNRRPPMDEELHDDALARGLIRYCPICDGYEVTDKKVGVIGGDSHGVAEAVFIRGFTPDVTLIAPDEALQLSREDQQKLKLAGLYAAGDIVIGLDQISHAMGEGGVAATTIRNDLAKERPLLR